MSSKGGDLIGRIIGMLVFLIGVALLIIVFYKAFDLFTAKPADALHAASGRDRSPVYNLRL